NLRELDSTTKVPFILIELTGEGDGEGEIEVTGKDEYGVYEALNNFFVHTWGCDPLDPGDETEDTKVPFCSAQYRWPGYSVKGDDGLNNQGLMTMRLIDFMCGNLSWTLAVVNGGNVGENRDVRETQLIFKAPHPMNLVAPHLLVEVRSAGFIEVCADLDEENNAILGSLDGYFADRFKASLIEGHEDFCDRYYEAGEGIFKGSGGSLDSNFGLLCTDVCDVITTHEGWSLVACNTGNYGADGRFSEQQMIFRRDYHPLGDSKYLQVILNALGNIEVNGQHVREIHSKLDGFFRGKWKCERAGHFREGDTLCRRYTWDVSELNMLRATADVVTFFELQGWATLHPNSSQFRTAVAAVAAACLASIACEVLHDTGHCDVRPVGDDVDSSEFRRAALLPGVIRVGRWMWCRQWRVRPAAGNTKSRIAVLINIQEYAHWPRVVDKSWGALCENMQRRSADWEVVTWPDLMERNVDSLVDLLVAKLHGLDDAKVLIYISCHSQMMDNDPQFLPADARGWGDGVSLSWLVRQLDAVRPRNARFYIIVNGCLTNAGRIDRWCRCCRRVQLALQSEELDSARLSTRMLRRRSDPQVWMLFAAAPGGEVAGDEQNGDLLTRKFLEALDSRPGSLEIEEIYNELHTAVWNARRDEGGPLHPYLVITTGRLPPAIPHETSEASQQTCASTSTLQSTAASTAHA
ncbi:unnamed protein product, partial [Symbiodinium sp. CCMP2456]